MSVFVNAQGIKTVHAGGGVKKWQDSVHVVIEWPLSGQIFLNLEDPIFAQIIFLLFTTYFFLQDKSFQLMSLVKVAFFQKVGHKQDDNWKKENYIDDNTGYQQLFHRFVFLLLLFLLQNGVKSFLKSYYYFYYTN